jgi:hypothetical protein
MALLSHLSPYALTGDTPVTPLDGGDIDTWGQEMNQNLRTIDNMALDYTTFKGTAVIKGVAVSGLILFGTGSLTNGIILPLKATSGAPAFAATNAGMSVFNPADGNLYVANGTSWIAIGATGSVPVASATTRGTVKTSYTESDPIVVLAGASTGGDPRGGTGAVDLQLTRSLSDEIAGADHSILLGGDQNKASQVYGIVVGGQLNYNDGINSIIGVGSQNHIGGTHDAVVSGFANEINPVSPFSADYSAILGGDTNLIEGDYSSILGGDNNHTSQSGDHAIVLGGTHNESLKPFQVVSGSYAQSRRYGEVVHSSGFFATLGDAQYSTVIMRGAGTGGTVELFCDGASERLMLGEDTSLYLEFIVVGRRQYGTSNEVYRWSGWALLNREPGGNVVLIESDVVPPSGTHLPPEGLIGWQVSTSFDTASQSFVLFAAHPVADPVGPPIIPARTMHWIAIVKVHELG